MLARKGKKSLHVLVGLKQESGSSTGIRVGNLGPSTDIPLERPLIIDQSSISKPKKGQLITGDAIVISQRSPATN